MFRDTSEELARLEEELLAEEEPEEELPPEEEADPWMYEDTRASRNPQIYQNYSNDYGKNLRNYASGYRAYNTDRSDEDLEQYSEKVRKGSRVGCLAVVLCLLAIAIAAAAVIWLAYERGLL